MIRFRRRVVVTDDDNDDDDFGVADGADSACGVCGAMLDDTDDEDRGGIVNGQTVAEACVWKLDCTFCESGAG